MGVTEKRFLVSWSLLHFTVVSFSVLLLLFTALVADASLAIAHPD